MATAKKPLKIQQGSRVTDARVLLQLPDSDNRPFNLLVPESVEWFVCLKKTDGTYHTEAATLVGSAVLGEISFSLTATETATLLVGDNQSLTVKIGYSVGDTNPLKIVIEKAYSVKIATCT